MNEQLKTVNGIVIKEIKTKDDQIVALTKAYKLVYKVSQASETEYDNNESISEAIEELNKALKVAIEAEDDKTKNDIS